ncbi:hypothetical protein [Frateuria defendens]|uniref:hypothetical protein n=1 Tax=Frateuria defendens TaxID=2219559 RepID=UPI00066FE3AD|nr:hypothetical protein [Frateuria defendens]
MTLMTTPAAEAAQSAGGPAATDTLDTLLGDWLELVRNHTLPPGFILLAGSFFYDPATFGNPAQASLAFWGLFGLACLYAVASTFKFTRRRFRRIAHRGRREFLQTVSFSVLGGIALGSIILAGKVADHRHALATAGQAPPPHRNAAA